jgi:hypothetical protein
MRRESNEHYSESVLWSAGEAMKNINLKLACDSGCEVFGEKYI